MSRIVRYFSDSDQMSYPCLKWNKEGKVCAMEMGTKNIIDKIDIEYYYRNNNYGMIHIIYKCTKT